MAVRRVVASGGTVSASLVPSRFDVVINGQGYIFSRREEGRGYFSKYPQFSYTKTFVERLNVQGDYSDSQADFFLTATQKDWSLGELQKYADTDADSVRRFWQGTNIDVSTIPGQVTLRQAVKSLTFDAAVRAACPRGQGSSQNVVAAATLNLYEVDPAGTITDRGAHGLGAAPARWGAATDGANVYVSTTAAGTVGVRKWTGSAYSTWSATQADALEYLNNSLYGLRNDTAELNVYSTAGVITQKFQWKDASGTARAGTTGNLKAYGGKLLILWSDGPAGAELWEFDGTNTSLIAQFPHDFYAHQIEVAFGVVFISGSSVRVANGNTGSFICRPSIYYVTSVTNGTLGKLWESPAELAAVSSVTTAGHPALTAYAAGLVFNDDARGTLMLYSADDASIETIGSYTVAGDTPLLAASQRMVVHTRNQAASYLYPDTTTVATSGTIDGSLEDYNLSLTKYFKSVTINADIPSGATIDLAYQLDSVSGGYTTFATGVASGTEYSIGQNARACSIQATLNKGSSASGPTLKRLQLRAAPIQTSFKLRNYVIALEGRDGKNMTVLNDGSAHTKDGFDMASDLITASEMTSPITITDEFGTFTGVIESDQFTIYEQRPNEFVAEVQVRQV